MGLQALAELAETGDVPTVLAVCAFLEVHTGEWRHEGMQHYCKSREADSGIDLCSHGGGVIRQNHWSCCGATSVTSLCKALDPKAAVELLGQLAVDDQRSINAVNARLEDGDQLVRQAAALASEAIAKRTSTVRVVSLDNPT